MRGNKFKKLKCTACGFLVAVSLMRSYGCYPRCGVCMNKCWVDADQNSDTVEIKYSMYPDTVLVAGIHGSTFTAVDEEELRRIVSDRF